MVQTNNFFRLFSKQATQPRAINELIIELMVFVNSYLGPQRLQALMMLLGSVEQLFVLCHHLRLSSFLGNKMKAN